MLVFGSDRACRSDPSGRHEGLPRPRGSLCAWRRSLGAHSCEWARRGEVRACLFPGRGEGGLGEALGGELLVVLPIAERPSGKWARRACEPRSKGVIRGARLKLALRLAALAWCVCWTYLNRGLVAHCYKPPSPACWPALPPAGGETAQRLALSRPREAFVPTCRIRATGAVGSGGGYRREAIQLRAGAVRRLRELEQILICSKGII